MRVIAFVAVVVAGVGCLFPVLPAEASPDIPPFEITFPQETMKTHFDQTFGASRSGGRRHKGNDLIAPRMTEVYAVAAGTVIDVDTHHLSGRSVKIDHGGGWESYYLHLNNDNIGTDDGNAPWTLTVAPGIEVGAKVEAGQLIGWVGDSGNAEWTTPHTQFEIHLDGRALNPYELLTDAYERDFARDLAMRFQTILPSEKIR
jgi:murein DD-endopeptidase MepM/ murein hydrolase activator NlpD